MGPRRDVELLTRPELDALRAASHGLTERMAADVYGISVNTNKRRLESARLKLAAKNTAHAVAIALRSGAIE